MSETAVKSLREWLRTCPEIDSGKFFRVDYIDDDPHSYAIYTSPSSISYKTDILGDLFVDPVQTVNYYLRASFQIGENAADNMANLAALNGMVEWMKEQNFAKHLPEIPEGKVVSLLPTLTPYPMAQGASAAVYQISIQLKYRT